MTPHSSAATFSPKHIRKRMSPSRRFTKIIVHMNVFVLSLLHNHCKTQHSLCFHESRGDIPNSNSLIAFYFFVAFCPLGIHTYIHVMYVCPSEGTVAEVETTRTHMGTIQSISKRLKTCLSKNGKRATCAGTLRMS